MARTFSSLTKKINETNSRLDEFSESLGKISNIKTPSSEDNELNKIQGNEADFLRYSCAVFGSMFLGEKNVESWSSLARKSNNAISNKKSVIFAANALLHDFDDFYNDFDSFNEIFNNTYNTDKKAIRVEITNDALNKSIDDIILSINNLGETLNVINFDKLKEGDTLSKIVDGLDTLTQIQEKRINDLEKQIQTTNTVIGNEKTSNASKIVIDTSKGFDINKNDLYSLLRFFERLYEINLLDKSVEITKNLNAFNIILNNNKGPIHDILTNIEKLNNIVISDNVHNSIITLQTFFNAITKIGNIGLFERIRMRSNMRFIGRYIVTLVNDIIEKLADSANTIKDIEQKNGELDVVLTFFDTIRTLVDIEDMRKRKMLINVLWIKYFITNNITDILETLIETVDKYNGNAANALKAIHDIIERIVNIGNYGFIKLLKLQIKSNIICDIISDFITSIVGALSNGLTRKEANKVSANMTSIINILSGTNTFITAIPKMSDIMKATVSVQMLNNLIITLSGYIKAILKLDNITPNTFNNIINNIVEGTKTFIESFNKIDFSGFNKLTASLRDITLVVTGTAIMLVTVSLLIKGIDFIGLGIFTFTLSVFLTSILLTFRIFKNSLKTSLDGAKDALLLVTGSAFILLTAGYVMKYIDLGNLISFTVTLGVFLFAITGTFNLFTKAFKKAMTGAKDAAELITMCGGILIAGGLFMNFIDPVKLAGFTVILGVFLFGIVSIFNKITESSNNRSFDKKLKNINKLITIISICGGMLIGAGLLMNFIKVANLFNFVLILGGFLIGITGIFTSFEKKIDDSFEAAKSLGLLIAVTGAVLIGACLVVDNLNGWEGFFKLLGFAAILGVFVWGITLALKPDSIKEPLKGAIELGILIGITGAILLFAGNIIIKQPEIVIGIAIFAGILYLFVRGIAKALDGKKIIMAIASGTGLGILIGMSAAILLFGGRFLIDHPEVIIGSAIFAGILYLFVRGIAMALDSKKIIMSIGSAIGLAILIGMTGAILLFAANVIEDGDTLLRIGGFVIASLALIGGMSAIAKLVGDKVKNIYKGILGVAAIEILCAGVAGIIWLLYKAISNYTDADFDRLDSALWRIAGMMVALGGVAAAFALLINGPQALVFLAGIAALGTIELFIYGITKIIQEMAIAAKMLDEVKDVDFTKLNTFIVNFASLGTTLISSFGFKAALIPTISGTVMALSKALSMMANVMKEWSDLKIPVYTGTQITGYITLVDDDFAQAGENIKKVAVCLGTTIIDIYKENPDMFKTNIWGNSAYSNVIKSMRNLGNVLGSMAYSVKEWADFKIPIYNGTKKSGYITLNDDRITKAGENIQSVVTALGSAIIDIYNHGDKSMFEPSGWLGIGKSPYAKVVKSMKTLGPTLASIARGVKQWADFRIPEYDKNGKVIGYKTIASHDLDKVHTNIQNVLTAIGNAIIDVYKTDKEHIFDAAIGKSPAVNVARAIGYMADVLNKTATTIYYYASGHFPIVEMTDGKVSIKMSKEELTDTNFAKAKTAIQNILTVLGTSITSVLDDPNKRRLFALGKNSPGAIAAKAINETAGSLKSIVDVIGSIMKMTDNFTKEIPFDNITANVQKLIEGLVGIVQLFANDSTAANSDKGWFAGIFGNRTMSVAEWLKEKVNDINDIAAPIKNLSTSLSGLFKNIGSIIKAWDNANKDNMLLRIYNNNNGVAAKGAQTFSSQLDTVLTGFISAIETTVNQYNKNIKLFKNSETQLKKWTEIAGVFYEFMFEMLSSLTGSDDSKHKKTGIITLINNLNSTDGTNYFDIIKNFIQNYNNLLSQLMSLGGNNINIISAMNDLANIGENKIDDIKKVFTGYSDILSGMVIIGDNVTKYGNENPFIKLANGINKLYTMTSSISAGNIVNFEKYEKDIAGFTRSINTIDIDNANVLIKILSLLNQLSEQGAPLKELANAITHDLSGAYDRLTKKLDEVKVIMNAADRLQAKREDSIKKNVEQVKTLMNSRINVDIRKVEEETNPGNTNPEDTGNPSSGNTDNANLTASPGGSNITVDNTDSNNKKETKTVKSDNSILEYPLMKISNALDDLKSMTQWNR